MISAMVVALESILPVHGAQPRLLYLFPSFAKYRSLQQRQQETKWNTALKHASSSVEF